MIAQQHTIQKRMVEVIDRQLASGSRSPWVLKMGPEKLRMVRSFVLSFIVEPSDRVIPYMSFPEPEGVEPVALGKPSDIEALAERLAKVEAQLAVSADPAWISSQFNKIDERFGLQMDLRLAQARDLNARIDKVAEIIGERVSGLVDRLDKLEKPWEHPPTEPAFPTGGAHTLEGATEAVLPVPQRGDRVRLEGARGEVSGRPIKDGWYDVTGWSANQIQIRVTTDRNGNPAPDWLPWLTVTNPAIKEVRNADHT